MKDPVAEAYARGGRVAAKKLGAAVGRPRARGSAGIPEIRTRAGPARAPRMPAAAPRPEAPLDPRKVFPVRGRSGSGEVAARADDAVPVDADEAEFVMRNGGRVRR